jgi:hypothetical protein
MRPHKWTKGAILITSPFAYLRDRKTIGEHWKYFILLQVSTCFKTPQIIKNYLSLLNIDVICCQNSQNTRSKWHIIINTATFWCLVSEKAKFSNWHSAKQRTKPRPKFACSPGKGARQKRGKEQSGNLPSTRSCREDNQESIIYVEFNVGQIIINPAPRAALIWPSRATRTRRNFSQDSPMLLYIVHRYTHALTIYKQLIANPRRTMECHARIHQMLCILYTRRPHHIMYLCTWELIYCGNYSPKCFAPRRAVDVNHFCGFRFDGRPKLIKLRLISQLRILFSGQLIDFETEIAVYARGLNILHFVIHYTAQTCVRFVHLCV